jgi:Arc/MetJ family transcription regulator
MGRTNVVVDDELVAMVMHRHRLRSKREAIDFALPR